ncbi:MAG: hypothetical protein E7812_14570 [Phenylobacterium sp.]|nr:MAG: hypothetical protein E7812_14570 [Phenylobacterium sp.]
MTESSYDEVDDVLPPEPNGELVRWMQPRPLTVGAAGISLATAGAFALGALAVVALLGMLHMRAAPRAVAVPRWVRRRI